MNQILLKYIYILNVKWWTTVILVLFNYYSINWFIMYSYI